jgi:hypothetical protein
MSAFFIKNQLKPGYKIQGILNLLNLTIFHNRNRHGDEAITNHHGNPNLNHLFSAKKTLNHRNSFF